MKGSDENQGSPEQDIVNTPSKDCCMWPHSGCALDSKALTTSCSLCYVRSSNITTIACLIICYIASCNWSFNPLTYFPEYRTSDRRLPDIRDPGTRVRQNGVTWQEAVRCCFSWECWDNFMNAQCIVLVCYIYVIESRYTAHRESTVAFPSTVHQSPGNQHCYMAVQTASQVNNRILDLHFCPRSIHFFEIAGYYSIYMWAKHRCMPG